MTVQQRQEISTTRVSANVKDNLACAYCGGDLQGEALLAVCSGCGSKYPITESGALDLRLRKPKTFSFDFQLGTPLLPEAGFNFGVLATKANPDVDFSTFAVPRHMTREMLTHFPKARTDRSLMLDLGCGSMGHRAVGEHAGFEYVGLDYDSAKAPLLGDAHALPFKDESFEFALSIATLEHLQFPFVAMSEVHRVLQPGGVFIGSVAFLEPFHANSFYHHTHLGTFNSLKEAGFKVECVAPSAVWTVLIAQASMGLFPKLPRPLAKLIVAPINILHRLWWKMGRLVSKKSTEQTRVLNSTGAFTFIARKV